MTSPVRGVCVTSIRKRQNDRLPVLQGKLLAGVNARVQIFKWQKDDDGAHELSLECQHTGHILALYVRSRGDFIAVGEASWVQGSPST